MKILGRFLKKGNLPKKHELLELGPVLVDCSSVSMAKLINALANYFKHSEEWSKDWNKLKGLQKHTADVFRELDAELDEEELQFEGWRSHIMKTGSKVLGNPEFKDTTVLESGLLEWGKAVLKFVKKELETASDK